VILPTKHLSPRRSLLGVGGLILERLDQPRTITGLWDRARRVPEVGSFDRFILALDLLYAMNAVVFERGLLRRTSA
jgi:hypothetical protein